MIPLPRARGPKMFPVFVQPTLRHSLWCQVHQQLLEARRSNWPYHPCQNRWGRHQAPALPTGKLNKPSCLVNPQFHLCPLQDLRCQKLLASHQLLKPKRQHHTKPRRMTKRTMRRLRQLPKATTRRLLAVWPTSQNWPWTTCKRESRVKAWRGLPALCRPWPKLLQRPRARPLPSPNLCPRRSQAQRSPSMAAADAGATRMDAPLVGIHPLEGPEWTARSGDSWQASETIG